MTLYSRRVAIGVLAGMSLPAALAPVPALAQAGADPVMKAIRDVEARLQSRLGVNIRDLEGGRVWSHRADERFPMCSTFKALAAAAVLARVDRSEDRLDRRIIFPASELVTYSPVTKEHVGEPGMTIGDICAAAVATSDNTAGNLMLKSIGGPEGLTRFLRGTGDETSRLDRWETELNEATPVDPRDTTSPAALSATMEKLVLGSALSAGSRDQARGLARRQQGGRHQGPCRPPEGLEGRRQDRRGRLRHEQRHRPDLAAGTQADRLHNPDHRDQGLRRGQECGHGRDRKSAAQRDRSLKPCRAQWTSARMKNRRSAPAHIRQAKDLEPFKRSNVPDPI